MAIVISEKTKQAIISVAESCGADMDYADYCDPAIMAEVVLDAGRLGMAGHTEAQEEVRALIAKHSWWAVLRAVEPLVKFG